MRLTPWEEERLLIFSAAELARRHRAAGIALNAPEAIAMICDAMLEAARAGGRRFSRIHLVESILEPGRSVAPAYRSVAVRLEDGQVETGVKVVETETTITLGDAQGQTRVFQKSGIAEQLVTELSVMPEGLEKLLGDEEFVDLIAFLAEQR